MYKYMISYNYIRLFKNEFNKFILCLDLYNISYIILNGNLYFKFCDYDTELIDVSYLLLLSSNEGRTLIRRLLWK